MELAGNVLAVLFFVLAPAGMLVLCRKVKALGKMGPVLLLYIAGIVFGNLFHPSAMAGIQELLSSAMVPLAIPLMLFSCTFSRSRTRSQLLALITGMFAVVAAVVTGFFLFGRDLPDGAKVGAMLTGVYTGGTINLASLKAMLDVPEETFVLLNSYDMAVCFVYLTFLMSFGIRLSRKILPNEMHEDFSGDIETDDALRQARANPYKGLFTREGLKSIGFLLGVDVLVIGVSAGLGLLAGDAFFMTVLILSLTTFGIAASFWKPVRTRKYGYDVGMYFIYIFSVVVASMADLRKFDIAGSLPLLGYLSFVIFGSLAIQVLLSKVFRIDADTSTIASVTYICSPPFVPMMVSAMKNRNVLASGLAIGVVGYAAGNYLGFLIFRLLTLLQ